MSKQEFLYRLEKLLMDLPRDEREDALDYYEQYFEAAGPDQEEEVIRELGSPEKVSEMIHSGGSLENSGRKACEKPAAPAAPGKSRTPLWIALAVAGAVIVLILLFLIIGIINFAKIRTRATVEDSVENTERQGLDGLSEEISGFVDDVMEEVGNSLEKGLGSEIGTVWSDSILHEIQQKTDQELGRVMDGRERWDGMQDDYKEGEISVQQEGKVTLKAGTPVAWKEIRKIQVNLQSAAVLFQEVSGETLQVETGKDDRIQAQFEDGTLTLENTEEAGSARDDDTVIIFLPESTELDSLGISCGSGYFETGNLQVKTLDVDLPDGVWKTNGGIHAETIAFEMNDGYLETGTMAAEKSLTISLKDGVISGELLDSPKISMECQDGIIRGTLAGSQDDYRWKASVGDGILEIGAHKSWDSLENDQGEKSLNLSVNDGAAKLSFEEE